MSYWKKTVFTVDTTRVTLNKNYQYILKTMLTKLWLYIKHIFVDVLNQNNEKCDSHFNPILDGVRAHPILDGGDKKAPLG